MIRITNRVRVGLREIAIQTANSFRAQICAICLSANGSLEEAVAHGCENFSFWLDQPTLSELLRMVAASGEPLYFNTLDHSTGKFASLSTFLKAQGIQAFVALPMLSHDCCHGTLSLFFTSTRDFSESELLHLSAVANAATLALHAKWEAKAPEYRNGFVFESMVAKSATMYQVFEIIKKVAPTDSSVLIFGESGTGKELVARCIHKLSRRKNKAFVAVDCVALPSSLLESELFGYEKAAFTGAIARKHGLLEIAHGGTFFLDEISELDLMLQAKLLRVLQERQYRRIGGQELIDVDIRVISATNRNPEIAVREKILREDLYFRLNVIPIYVPALRERKEDIPLLANYFLDKFIEANDIDPKELAPETIQALQEYDWPGNVRELQNVIERVTALSSSNIILPEELPPSIRECNETATPLGAAVSPALKTWRENLNDFKRMYFKMLLESTNGDIPNAARQAKVSPRTIYRIARTI